MITLRPPSSFDSPHPCITLKPVMERGHIAIGLWFWQTWERQTQGGVAVYLSRFFWTLLVLSCGFQCSLRIHQADHQPFLYLYLQNHNPASQHMLCCLINHISLVPILLDLGLLGASRPLLFLSIPWSHNCHSCCDPCFSTFWE